MQLIGMHFFHISKMAPSENGLFFIIFKLHLYYYVLRANCQPYLISYLGESTPFIIFKPTPHRQISFESSLELLIRFWDQSKYNRKALNVTKVCLIKIGKTILFQLINISGHTPPRFWPRFWPWSPAPSPTGCGMWKIGVGNGAGFQNL